MKPELRPYFLLALAIVFLDQLSKITIRSYFVPGESVQVLGDFLRFTFVYNQGGAFGIKLGNYLFYSMAAILAAAVTVYYLIKSQDSGFWPRFILAMVIGGAIGNLIDRLAYGQVVDFIDVDMPNFNIPEFTFVGLRFYGYEIQRWFTFNIADSAVTVGLTGFVIYMLFGDRPKTEPADPVQPEQTTNAIE